MGFWSSVGSAFGSACSSIGSSSQSKVEDDATYKKYVAEIRNFELDPKLAKKSTNQQRDDFQLNQIQDELDDIDSIGDVKKHFQDK